LHAGRPAGLTAGRTSSHRSRILNGWSTPRVRAASGCSLSLLVSFALSASIAFAEDATPKEKLRHGSRDKAADGTMVVYDKVNGVFIVPTRPMTYWIDKRFYQYENGVWLSATALAGPWEMTQQHLVPDIALERHPTPKEAVTAKLPWGRDAVYDPRIKVFKVAGKKGVFLFDARFYQYDNGVWLESKKEDGPWMPTSMKILPVPLRKAVPLPEDGQEVTLPSGEKVVYEEKKRVFRLEKKPEIVLFDGTFYEQRDDKWFAAPSAAAGFKEMQIAKVPPPVRAVGKKVPIESEKKEKGAKKAEGKAGAGKKDADAKATKKAKDGKSKKAEKVAPAKNGKKSPDATTGDGDEHEH
jgi:hypothetical protein